MSVTYGVPQPPYPDYHVFLREQVCAADIVALARPATSKTMLNSSGTFLFTDHTVKADEVIRGKVGKGEAILYSRPGGVIEHDGRRVAATISGHRELDVRRQYVFFLKAMRGASGYEGLPRLSVIELQGNKVLSMPRARWTPREIYFQQVTPAQLVRDLRSAATRCPMSSAVAIRTRAITDRFCPSASSRLSAVSIS